MGKPVVGIIGDSGTGKSSMLETLTPERTCILNTENKPLPMRNFNKFNNIMVTSFKKLSATLDALSKPENVEKYDYVVLDSFTSTCETVHRYANKVYTGYEIWGQYNEMIVDILIKLKALKQQVFIIALPEQKAEQFGETKSYARIKGKELKYGFFEKELAIVLYTNPIYDDDTDEMLDVEMDYVPNKRNSAKAPRGLFESKPKNDAKFIADAIENYYKD
ncbi:MAG: AAA family ATPase [Helicobacteraceae bacterium]|nr:AAA family ATPase [Helicobacteraceae bacterium]